MLNLEPQEEIWRSCVVGYEVSNLGNVRGIDRMVEASKGMSFIQGETISGWIDKYGYNIANLSINGNDIHCRVHRLVAISFINNPEDKPEVNHIDADKLNNKVNNLEWATRDENIAHAVALGLFEVGEDRYNSKLTDLDVECIKFMLENNDSATIICELFNAHRSTVRDIRIGKNWKHIPWSKGYNPESYSNTSRAGENHALSRLKDSDVVAIKLQISKNIGLAEIAREFYVDSATICQIKDENTWKHIPWPEHYDPLSYVPLSNEGAGNFHAKLTEANVYEIYDLIASGLSDNKISVKFGVGSSTIYKIRIGKTWSYLLSK